MIFNLCQAPIWTVGDRLQRRAAINQRRLVKVEGVDQADRCARGSRWRRRCRRGVAHWEDARRSEWWRRWTWHRWRAVRGVICRDVILLLQVSQLRLGEHDLVSLHRIAEVRMSTISAAIRWYHGHVGLGALRRAHATNARENDILTDGEPASVLVPFGHEGFVGRDHKGASSARQDHLPRPLSAFLDLRNMARTCNHDPLNDAAHVYRTRRDPFWQQRHHLILRCPNAHRAVTCHSKGSVAHP